VAVAGGGTAGCVLAGRLTIMPTIPRAYTNLSTAAIAEKIAEMI